ncbi:MAG: hypothetical protein JNG85_00615 [Spirochaetaceae bacterium]|nr:hypothetical protein [Spirochaetaceae bacterium]
MLEEYFTKGRELVGRISSLGYLLERGFFVFACGVLLAGLVALSGGSRGFRPAKAGELGPESAGAPERPEGPSGERYRRVREIIGR